MRIKGWMRLMMLMLCAAGSIGGCGARPNMAAPSPKPMVQTSSAAQASYDGRSLGEWAQELKNPDAKRRIGGAWAIGRMGPAAAAAVPALIEALNDPDRLVRTQSIASLGKIGPAASPAVPTLDYLAQDNDWATRQLASAALAAIQGKPLPANNVGAGR